MSAKDVHSKSMGLLVGVVLGASGCGQSTQVDTPGSAEQGGHPGTLLVLDALKGAAPNVRALVNDVVIETDATGHAVLPPDLPAAYDVAVYSGPSVYAFVGMTTRSPTVVLTNQYLNPKLAGASVDILNPADLGPDQRVLFTIGALGAEAAHQVTGWSSDSGGAYLGVNWIGPSSATLSVEAFLVDLEPTSRQVLDYLGYATRDFPDADGLEATWTPEFGPMPFEVTTAGFEVELPEGASFDFTAASLFEASGRSGPMGSADAASATFLLPKLPGATCYFSGLTYDDDSAFAAEARDVAFGSVAHARASKGPTALAPADGATVSVDTEFSWTAADGAVYYLLAYTTDDGPYLDYTIATSSPSARLPELSSLGLPFPVGRRFDWSAHSELGHASLDTYAAGEPPNGRGYSYSRTALTSAP